VNGAKWPLKLPDYRLDGKVAVITGGTKGIGYAIALMFAGFGASVVVTSRHQDQCEEVAAEIRNHGGSALGVAADVSKVADIRRLMRTVVEQYEHLDILVNCAGIAVTKPIFEMEEEDYDRVMDTNLRSVFFASKEAAKLMAEQGTGGRIIQIASIGGLKGTNQVSTYCASKAAVLNLTKTMALEWSRYQITTTAICPGYVKTDINAAMFDNPEFLAKALKGIPQRRLGTAEEVAAIALFLASEYSGMISGSAVIADMGATSL
jgi:NAD(P)-dependent dehydrogenase (short-subunit alcohol dehydrogenase family)